MYLGLEAMPVMGIQCLLNNLILTVTGASNFLQCTAPSRPFNIIRHIDGLALCQMDDVNVRVAMQPKHGADRLVELSVLLLLSM
jgi:hypothetical protein